MAFGCAAQAVYAALQRLHDVGEFLRDWIGEEACQRAAPYGRHLRKGCDAYAALPSRSSEAIAASPRACKDAPLTQPADAGYDEGVCPLAVARHLQLGVRQ